MLHGPYSYIQSTKAPIALQGKMTRKNRQKANYIPFTTSTFFHLKSTNVLDGGKKTNKKRQGKLTNGKASKILR